MHDNQKITNKNFPYIGRQHYKTTKVTNPQWRNDPRILCTILYGAIRIYEKLLVTAGIFSIEL